ncbi:50S ribosomal protein L15e [Candidatus Woesearchaeota archaeon CG10_big_fil_rev_8_21_14_0_10_32_24]|nr:MAG: 50S ribosomal protein L15e [Candidatus Woesearchaeota archaeon CG10_big_fil_rev_8_21_14_0_10_32_24]
MGIYSRIREIWKKPQEGLGELWRERLLAWRKEDATTRIERPTRLDRARSLGYKAKQGFVIIRQRVPRGGHKRPRPNKGRRPKRYGTKKNLSKNYQQIAEDRAQKKFLNLTVLNSYWVMQDGIYYWYEVIMVDPNHPVIKSDKNLQWLQSKKTESRVFQGKTSAGKKGSGKR